MVNETLGVLGEVTEADSTWWSSGKQEFSCPLQVGLLFNYVKILKGRLCVCFLHHFSYNSLWWCLNLSCSYILYCLTYSIICIKEHWFDVKDLKNLNLKGSELGIFLHIGRIFKACSPSHGWTPFGAPLLVKNSLVPK